VKFKIAFDLDETLDFGTAVARLCNMVSPLAQVTVLSARTSTDPTVADKLEKLKRLGIATESIHLHVVHGETNEARAYRKAEYCRDNEIDLFIDNNRVYCDHVKAMSPHTTVLHRV
jgi:hypothetical protein